MIKGGLIDYWRLLVNRKTPKNESQISLDQSSEHEDSHYKAINLNQLKSALYMLIIGIIASFSVFSIEVFISFKILK